SPTTDPDPDNNTDDEPVRIDRAANVWIIKSHTGTAEIGEETTFTLQVGNDGPSDARDVVVTDALPDGLELVAANGAGWTCEATDPLRCVLTAPLAPDAEAPPIAVTVRVLPSAYPVTENLADVTTTTPETNADDNSDVERVEIPALADLGVVKTHRGQAKVGEQVTFDLVVTNHGPTPDPGPITVTDTLPEGLGFVAASGDGWVCDQLAARAGGTVDCEYAGTLSVGEAVRFAVTAEVLPAAYPEVSNVAAVGSPSADPESENDTSTDVVPVEPTVDLALDKSIAAVKGKRIRYRLAVTNNGPSATVAPIRLTDRLPKGLR